MLGWNLLKILQQEEIFEYAGDAREFTPYAVNTKRSRLEQEVIIDFYKKEIFTYADACIVTVKITNPDGSIEYKKGKTSTENIVCTNVVWGADEVSFEMRASASNPLNAAAPAADYLLTIQLTKVVLRILKVPMMGSLAMNFINKQILVHLN